ncbi:serine hydrolase domain-containing protein [Arenibacterium sp. CAU 1754]
MNKSCIPPTPSDDEALIFEGLIDPDFTEAWPDRVDADARERALSGRLIRRSHWDNIVPGVLGFHGPVFDRNRMVNALIEQMTDRGAVGFSWAIVQNGQLVDAGGLGDARTAAETDQRPMAADTRMVSASMAKPVCAMTVMKLIDDGELSLDDAAYPFIEPTFPGAHDTIGEITIRDLLTHRSGFNGPGRLSRFPGTLGTPLTNAPGTSTRYENWNYWFLAYVVEAVSGSPYVDVATQTVLDPMGITGMTREADNTAPCLYYDANSLSDGRSWGDFTATAIGAYGWFASALDWARFMAHFRHDTVLSRTARRTMLNWNGTYFGFRHRDGQDRGSYYGHDGDFATGGREFHGSMIAFPDGIDAVLLTNSDDVGNPDTVLIDAYHAAYA